MTFVRELSILISGRPSLADISRNVANQIDPRDQRIETLITSRNSTRARAELREKQRKRIIRTSWEDVARKSPKQFPTGRGRRVAEIGLIDRIGLGQSGTSDRASRPEFNENAFVNAFVRGVSTCRRTHAQGKFWCLGPDNAIEDNPS